MGLKMSLKPDRTAGENSKPTKRAKGETMNKPVVIISDEPKYDGIHIYTVDDMEITLDTSKWDISKDKIVGGYNIHIFPKEEASP